MCKSVKASIFPDPFTPRGPKRRALAGQTSAGSALTALAVAGAVAGSASASPWARGQNEALVISQTGVFTSTEPVSVDGQIVRQRFNRLETDLYVEYGVTPSIMIGGKAIYGTSELRRGGVEVETASGVSEYGGFLQYQFLRNDRHAASARIGAFSPSSLDDGVRTETAAEGVDADIALLYGRNVDIAPFGVFVGLDAGYRRRFGDAADQIRLQAEIGAKPGRRWVLLIQSFGEFSLRNETGAGADFDIVKINPSIVRRFGDGETGRWSLQLGYSEEIAGRNVARGRKAFVSVWTAF